MGAQPAARALLHIYLFGARDFLVAGGCGDSVTVMVPNQEITGRTLDNCNCPRVHGQNSGSCTEVSVRLLSREMERNPTEYAASCTIVATCTICGCAVVKCTRQLLKQEHGGRIVGNFVLNGSVYL